MKLTSSGFSLIELLVGGAILAGIGLTGAQLIRGQKTVQTKIDHELELELIHAKLTSMFTENAKDCDVTFRGINLATTAISEIRRCNSMNCDPRLPASSSNSFAVVYRTGTYAAGYVNMLSPRNIWYIESFGILRPHNQVPGSLKTNLMILPVNYAHTKIPNRRVTKFVTVAMRFDTGNNFVQCIDGTNSTIHNLEREVCNLLRATNSLGTTIRGTWNGNTHKCNSDITLSECGVGSASAGIPGSGVFNSSFCVPTGTTISTHSGNSNGPLGMIDPNIPVCRTGPVRLSGASLNRITVRCQ